MQPSPTSTIYVFHPLSLDSYDMSIMGNGSIGTHTRMLNTRGVSFC